MTLQALFEALKDGAAADLIELDLRGNPFSIDDLNRLVRRLCARLYSQHRLSRSESEFAGGFQLHSVQKPVDHMHKSIHAIAQTLLRHCRRTYGRPGNSSASWLEHRRHSSLLSRCHPLRFRPTSLLRLRKSRAWQRTAVLCQRTLLLWSCNSSRSVCGPVQCALLHSSPADLYMLLHILCA